MQIKRGKIKKLNDSGTTLIETLAAFTVLAAILAILFHIVDFSSRLRTQAVDTAHLDQMFWRELYKNDENIDSSFIEVNEFVRDENGKIGVFWLALDVDNTAELGTIVHICKGKQLNGEFLSDVGKYYVMNGGITPSGYYKDYNTLAGTISISEGGNSCGFVQYNEKPFWSGGHCYTLLQTTDERIQYTFLYHVLKSKQDDIMALRIGSGLPNIQKKDLGKYPIPILSYDSQIAITKLFDAVCQHIEMEQIRLPAAAP